MIPDKASKSSRAEYVKLHYFMQKIYRKKYPYIPFRYIQKHIARQWQIKCYNKADDGCDDNTPHQGVLKWCEPLETVKEI